MLLHHGVQPARQSFNAGLITDNKGEIQLYYRKMHPWVPVEPWEPGDLGIPVCDGPNGSKIALIICARRHVPRDGARERLQGRRNIMIRTAGYTAPIRQSWHFTNQSNAFCNLDVHGLGLPAPAPTARSTRWAKA